MAGVKISDLPEAETVNDTDQLELNQSGVSRKTAISQIRGAFLFVSVAAPAAPVSGTLWFASTLGELFIWYIDGASVGQWVPATPPVEPA